MLARRAAEIVAKAFLSLSGSQKKHESEKGQIKIDYSKSLEALKDSQFGLLPSELILMMLQYVDPHDLLVVSLISKHFHQIVTDESIWKALLEDYYQDTDALLKENPGSYKHAFFKKYNKENYSYILTSPTDSEDILEPIRYVNAHPEIVMHKAFLHDSLSRIKRALMLEVARSDQNEKIHMVLKFDIPKSEVERLIQGEDQNRLLSHIVEIYSIQPEAKPTLIAKVRYHEGELEHLDAIAASPKLN